MSSNTSPQKDSPPWLNITGLALTGVSILNIMFDGKKELTLNIFYLALAAYALNVGLLVKKTFFPQAPTANP